MPTEVTVSTGTPAALSVGFRRSQRAVRNERVVGAVNQEDGRARAQLAGQQFRGEQPAREADDAGDRRGAAQADKQRHHRALREPDQRQFAAVEAAFFAGPRR